ncbi:hypothetical protein ES702_01814 [subsurface metagenome]
MRSTKLMRLTLYLMDFQEEYYKGTLRCNISLRDIMDKCLNIIEKRRKVILEE